MGTSGPAALHVSCWGRGWWPVRSSVEAGGMAAWNTLEALCHDSLQSSVVLAQVRQAQVVLASMRAWPRRRHSRS